MIEAFKKYSKLGLKCLPTKKDKSPDINGTWKGGITDERQYKNAKGIGIICGDASGKLECLDFDNHFGDANEVITEFIKSIQPIYDKHKFPIESTMSGGFHLLLKCEEIEGNQKLAQRPKWDEQEKKHKPDTIIETRGQGGYFVADPSEGYKIIRGSLNQIPTVSKEERRFMIEAAKSFNTWATVKPEIQESNDRPGDLFNKSESTGRELVEALKSAGWNDLGSGRWTRPDKKDGVSATLGKVAENIFYCFTSNGYPFEPNKAYSPFQVVTLLKYNGDFTSHAKDLAERYNLSKPIERKYGDITPRILTKNDLEDIFNKTWVNLAIPVKEPTLAIKIKDFDSGEIRIKRLFTLGNFSAITGKMKSKKTFLTTLMLAAASSGGEIESKLIGSLPEGKNMVLFFDTEQSYYDTHKAGTRVAEMSAKGLSNFETFCLREHTPLGRCQFIDYTLQRYAGTVGYVIIDGIADLAKGINDEEEATRVTTLLMKWTKVYDCHITTVIHQNKADDYATGHLGSAVLKKAETIISIKKDEVESRKSLVHCSMIRGTSHFEDFEILINDKGMPEIEDMEKISKSYNVIDYT